jgi:hypothetical protein
MNKTRWIVLLAALPLLALVPTLPACSLDCVTQTNIEILSDTTEGTFAFSGSGAKSLGNGSVGYTDGTATVSAQSSISISIVLSVSDNDTLTITLATNGVSAGTTTPIPSGSLACLNSECSALEGSFSPSSLAIDCSNGPSFCALTLTGELKATATFTKPATAVTLNLALAHQDQAASYCESARGESAGGE